MARKRYSDEDISRSSNDNTLLVHSAISEGLKPIATAEGYEHLS